MNIEDFYFDLPESAIAQHPAEPRGASRMLQVGVTLVDRMFADLPSVLRRGDVLVTNDTKVIPAQLTARRGAARIGVTLNRALAGGVWHVLVRKARRLKPGDVLSFEGASRFAAEVVSLASDGSATLRFDRSGEDFTAALHVAGALALPPYIARPLGPTERDAGDYQTVFARREGAVAAPTAGLHFTPDMLALLKARGVLHVNVTLHVGAGTFLPVRNDAIRAHKLHPERGVLTAEVADAVNEARRAGGRVIAVGTTSLRLMESACDGNGVLREFDGETDIFILPGDPIRSADLLLTNFHLPRSTLFMLVCAFAGTARMRAAYRHAIDVGYRFYSYGDCCLLERSA